MKLHHLLAIEKTIKSDVNRVVSDIYKSVQHTPSFVGMSRKYEPLNDEDQSSEEYNPVTCRAEDMVKKFADSKMELWSCIASKDRANQDAEGFIEVDGERVTRSLPATTLLSLEKEVQDCLAFIRALPVLTADKEWSRDEATGYYRSKEQSTQRTKKVPKVLVKYEATEKHPAQTEVYQEDVVIGSYRAHHLSGAMEPSAKEKMENRCLEALKAIKKARERANEVEVYEESAREDVKPLLQYIFE